MSNTALNLNHYSQLSSTELNQRIIDAKRTMGSELLILGHHYMRDDVIKFADFKGDSLKLSQQAAMSQAKYIIFLGVYFMAETADILTAKDQTIIIPDKKAGCDMADMAEIEEVYKCWNTLQEYYPDEIIPISYINSSAELKAFCGKHGGLICTSSNAPAALRWALNQDKRILFFPDEHLGRNTGKMLGIPDKNMAVWNRFETNLITNSTSPDIILWNGYCPVHLKFSTKHIKKLRNNYPDINIIVHPECSNALVEQADASGSTEYIAKIINNAPSGSKWAIGTEINMVNRLANQHQDKTIVPLTDTTKPCISMFKIEQANLLWCLENLNKGIIENQVNVSPKTASDAKIALDRMLSIK